MKYLITNADDYGYKKDISRAIIDSNKNGFLTSTTVLINFVSQKEALDALTSSSLGVGLHLNLTSGNPLTKNWLKKYGVFKRPKRNKLGQFDRELWLKFFKKFDSSDIYIEYKAQIEKFIEIFKKLPTHIDSHHYHSSFINAFEPFIDIAKEYSLPVRNQVMFDWSKNQHQMGNIDLMPSQNKIVLSQNIRTTNYFSLLYPNRYSNYLDVLKSELDKINNNEIIEISFHPGIEEDWRKKDRNILKNKAYVKALEKLEVQLINYSQLAFNSPL